MVFSLSSGGVSSRKLFTGPVRLSRVLFVLRRHYFFLEAVSTLLLTTCIRTAVLAPRYVGLRSPFRGWTVHGIRREV
jgi:hypothetical protein